MKNLLAFLILLVIIPFFGLQKIQAEENPPKVIINELMWAGSSKSTYDEWIELKNTTDKTIDLSGWSVYYLGSDGERKMLDITSGRIRPSGYFLISNYDKGSENTILNISPNLVDTSVTLSNTKLQIKLFNKENNLVDTAGSGGAPLAGSNALPKSSMQRNETIDDGTLANSWHSATETNNLISGAIEYATPERAENTSPTKPELILPESSANITAKSDIQFVWQKSIDQENDPLEYTMHFSCDNTFLSNNYILSNLANNYYQININDIREELGDCNNYYWKVFATDGELESESDENTFKISEPQYCGQIIINELMPNPSDDQTKNEWIELKNLSNENVNLKNWYLEDTVGSTKRYIIDYDLIIPASGFIVLFRSQTGITLNDDKDGVKLFQPNGNLLYATKEYESSKDDISWARNSSNDWIYTTTKTPNSENIFTKEEEMFSNNESINTEPIEIETGDVKKYDNKLIKIIGEVTETSGNTFYIDDGSGEIKVYIQEKTNISKPKMRKGDIFQIIGIVDYYRGVWRILPRFQDDVILIELVTTTKAKETKNTNKEDSGIDKEKNTPNIIGKVKAATTDKDDNKNQDNNNWLQLVKLIILVAVIGLIYLLYKIKNAKKEKTIGGNFGEDET